MRIESKQAFEEAVKAATAVNEKRTREIMVCCGTGCLANGSQAVADAFALRIGDLGLDVKLSLHAKTTGCHGFCERGPLVVLKPEGILYTKVKPRDVDEILEKTVGNGEIISRLLYRNPENRQPIEKYEEIPFYKHQVRVSMRNIGRIDPASLDDALAHGAYAGMARALFELTPEQVIAEVRESGLRGRGGAGFSTARKWDATCKAVGERKFVLCNGDEGDPGAFKDRSIMEGDPHAVIEGMVIGAYAIGAREGYVYVRDEYPLAVHNMNLAIEKAKERGLLGKNILGTGFDFDLKVSRGGGAFVCGESSALMRSIEGKIGEPRAKYIHASDKGLFDLPTALNNVETWSVVGQILNQGGAWFASMGTKKSKGTKSFSLVGKVKNTGLIELPMGTTLRHIIFDIGGGILKNRPFKAVQTGGPSGGCLPADKLDLPVDYEVLSENGSMMGSGGMIVMDDRTCMVDVARYFLNFLIDESCGKCIPCREGLKQMLHIFDDLVEGRGKPGDIERIERLCKGMQLGSLCELGKSAPNPVLSTLQYFRDEYEAHINDKVCPAGMCRELTTYKINHDPCTGCHMCTRVCPTDAISGKPKEKHAIDQQLCISCGSCFDVCPEEQCIVFLPKKDIGGAHATAGN